MPGIFLRFARKRNRDPGRRTGRYSKGRTRRGSSTLFSITRRFKVGQLSRETFTRFRTPQFSLSFALRPLVPHPHLPVFYPPLPSCKSLSKCSMQLLCRPRADSTLPLSVPGIISPSPAVLTPISALLSTNLINKVVYLSKWILYSSVSL